MWIRTQDKKSLVNVIKLNIVKVLSGDHKGILYGYTAGISLFHSNSIVLAKYKTYDEALDELNKLENKINDHSNNVYQMS